MLYSTSRKGTSKMVESADEDFEKQVSFGFIKEYNERRPWTRVFQNVPSVAKSQRIWFGPNSVVPTGLGDT